MAKEQGITRGRWFSYAWESQYRIDGDGLAPVVYNIPHKEDAEFIVTALNQCQAINPDHPEYVAEGIGEMVEALKGLLNTSVCDICYEDDCGGEFSCTKGKYGEPCKCHEGVASARNNAQKIIAAIERGE